MKNNLIEKIGGPVLLSLVGLIIFINFFAGIIGGIWLLFIGDWPFVVYGIIISVLMPFFYSLLSIIGFWFINIANNLIEKKKYFSGYLIVIISSLYLNSLLAYWIYYVFTNLVQDIGLESMPQILFGYGVALGPLSYMAQNESPENSATTIGMIQAILSYIILALIWLMFGYLSITSLIVFILSFSTFALIILINTQKKSSTDSIEISPINSFNCEGCNNELKSGVVFCKHCGLKNSK